MTHKRHRLVLLCQQSLSVALVAAVAAPAAQVVSLRIVTPSDGQRSGELGSTIGGASRVAASPVPAKVRRIPLVGVSEAGVRALGERSARAGLRLAAGTPTGSRGADSPAELAVLSSPQPVSGLATVGVTWSGREDIPEDDISIAVRTKRAGVWSEWTEAPYHEEEGPDPRSLEDTGATPGTDPVYVGGVDDVQVRARTDSGEAPDGMRLSLVDPGATQTSIEEPAIDPNAGAADGISDSTADDGTRGTPADAAAGSSPNLADEGALAAGTVTRRPVIYSRSQWGADERMRDRSSLRYGEVHGGFVHHTVNANGYSRAQVPSIIRGIYAYHTQSRGWSDVGYNFLVDRFGRVWEGRAGGVDRPVAGAHTMGYNGDAFAASAIGNFQTARPSAAVSAAFGRLMAWKLSLHGVRAASRRQWIAKRYVPAVAGHRDVAPTACPGRNLYAKLRTIRTLAARHQQSWIGRTRSGNLVGSRRADIVVRHKSTRQLFLVKTGGTGNRVARILRTGIYLRQANLLLNVGDWNGDGKGDLITRSRRSGQLFLFRGKGTGRFAAPIAMSRTSFGRVRLLAAVGDMTGDGRPDLLGQPAGSSMRIFPGNGSRGFRRSYVAHSPLTGIQQLGVGLWTADGAPDVLLRQRSGSLVLYRGNGPGGLTRGRRAGSVGRIYDWLLPVRDVTGDGRVDLVGRAAKTGKLWLLRNSTRGFTTRRSFRAGMGRFDLAG